MYKKKVFFVREERKYRISEEKRRARQKRRRKGLEKNGIRGERKLKKD